MTRNSHFLPREHFSPPPSYKLLPFRFGKLDEHRYILTNDVGEYVLASREDLERFVRHELPTTSKLYMQLKARQILFDDEFPSALDLLSIKYRTRAAPISDLTSLHIFVVTLRCDHSCHYCQVSRQTEDRANFDMSVEHADKAIEIAFQSPASNLKIEFQGGEPLLNFELIRHVVDQASERANATGRNLQFVIASNLTRLTAEILQFCKIHEVYFSTSLDGPQGLHDSNRPLRGGSSFQATIDGVNLIRATLGSDHVAALMTTTPNSLSRVDEIVDEYVAHGFESIFLRNLSPFGFAVRTSLVNQYDIDNWIAFYKRGLSRILAVNKRGYALREEMTSVLLQKLFLPSGSRYVDLQSPAGIAIAGIVYNYDGKIYASDEGRMLAEMGDTSFALGHVENDSFRSVILGETLIEILEDTLPESAPMCSDCPFVTYCGADPVFHKVTQGDVVGHKAFSAFCTKQMAVVRHVIGLLEDDPEAHEIMMGWI